MTESPGPPSVPDRDAVAAVLRSPIEPELFEQLRETPRYLAHVWPVLEASIDTAGFLGSALYLADMALDAVEEVYHPILDRPALEAALGGEDLAALDRTLDVFHYLLPQTLLAGAALAEAFDRPRVGGQGRVEPREPKPRDAEHLATSVELASPAAGPLPEVIETLQLREPPRLYRAVACWPAYLEAAWDELQHLAAYPDFRRRGRALYFYARSGAKFLARPLEADPAALEAAGVAPEEIARARAIVDGAVPTLATMVMHCTAMRLGLGHAEREVVRPS
jgi:hypothetical protein